MRSSHCLAFGSLTVLMAVGHLRARNYFGQRAMDKRNRDRPFPDCRCHAFDAAAPNVTHGEHARK